MDILNRIKLIVEKENLSSGLFAESIGVKQATLSHILTGRNKPSLDIIMKIHQRYTYINLEWLLYGKGDMMASATTASSEIISGVNQTDLGMPLFGQNLVNAPEIPEEQKKRREMPLETPVTMPKETVIQEIKYIERPHRKITEIRIFFDDNTYEVFKGEK